MNCKKCRNFGQEKFLDGAHSFCKVRYISSHIRFPVIRETDFSLSPSNHPSISRQTALMMRQTLVQSSQTVKLQKPIILLIISDTRKSLTPNLKCCKCFCLLPLIFLLSLLPVIVVWFLFMVCLYLFLCQARYWI